MMKVTAEPRPVAAFDLDGTLFKTSMLDAVLQTAVTHGLIHPSDHDKIDRLNYAWAHVINTENDYQDSVLLTVRTLLAAMTGQAPEDLHNLALEAAKAPLRRRRFVREAMELLENTHEIIIASASHVDITKVFLKEMRIEVPEENIFGSTWHIVNGRYSGEGITLNKIQVLQRLQDAGRIVLENSCAFGDTISDLEMLDKVEVGLMVNPSATLERAGADRLHTIKENKDNITYLWPGETKPPLRVQTPAQILERTGLITAT